MKLTNKEGIKQRLEENRWIDKTTGCWEWLLSRGNEYGRIKIQGKFYVVHRVSLYIYKNFDLNSPLRALHVLECPNKDCFNPDHLYPGTHHQNSLDTVAAGHNKDANKTHCIRGHPFDEKNTYIYSNGKRKCRACRRK